MAYIMAYIYMPECVCVYIEREVYMCVCVLELSASRCDAERIEYLFYIHWMRNLVGKRINERMNPICLLRQAKQIPQCIQ